jgi:hypothetical protein
MQEALRSDSEFSLLVDSLPYKATKMFGLQNVGPVCECSLRAAIFDLLNP